MFNLSRLYDTGFVTRKDAQMGFITVKGKHKGNKMTKLKR